MKNPLRVKSVFLFAGLLLASFSAQLGAQTIVYNNNNTIPSSVQIRYTTGLFSGPSTQFYKIGDIYSNESVQLHGCIAEYFWCDISTRYERGWVDGQDLYVSRQGYNSPYSLYESRVWFNYPAITFFFSQYWDQNYSSRPWYGKRGYYKNHDWRYDNKDRHYRNDYRYNKDNQHYRYPNNNPNVDNSYDNRWMKKEEIREMHKRESKSKIISNPDTLEKRRSRGISVEPLIAPTPLPPPRSRNNNNRPQVQSQNDNMRQPQVESSTLSEHNKRSEQIKKKLSDN